MKLIISGEMPLDLRAALTVRGFELLLLPPCRNLDAPVASHPDMLIFAHNDKILTTNDYFSIARDVIGTANTILTEEKHGKEYPRDILLNALYHGGKLYGYKNHLSRKLLEFFGGECVNVRQGYAHCSCCKVGDGVITADPSMQNALVQNGVDVLKIESGHISLPGYDCGFIGGASFEDKANVYFFGDLLLHPDGRRIADFCKNHGKNAVSLSNEALCDYGSAVIIE